jgi:ATP-dependent DNA ligase
MDLPVMPPVEPMLATSAKDLPLGEGLFYEPKWDGFRCIAFRDGDEVELGSRSGKSLTRYFPEVVEALKAELPAKAVLDGEIIAVRPGPDGDRLDFDTLSQRIHPADSRVRMLAKETPASFVAFDLLAVGGTSYLDQPYATRRAELEKVLAGAKPPVHLTPVTSDPVEGQHWFAVFEGAGLDGIVCKKADGIYAPGKRTMTKVKHARTADVVVAGFRWHTSGPIVGSLLLGLYDGDGQLQHIGVSASFTAQRRKELVDELAPYRENALENHPWSSWATPDSSTPERMPGAQSRWSGKKDLSWQPLRPELVVEVAYDHMEGTDGALRFRHTARFQRWRPDREPTSCTYEQLDTPVRYDLDAVLAGRAPVGE